MDPMSLARDEIVQSIQDLHNAASTKQEDAVTKAATKINNLIGKLQGDDVSQAATLIRAKPSTIDALKSSRHDASQALYSTVRMHMLASISPEAAERLLMHKVSQSLAEENPTKASQYNQYDLEQREVGKPEETRTEQGVLVRSYGGLGAWKQLEKAFLRGRNAVALSNAVKGLKEFDTVKELYVPTIRGTKTVKALEEAQLRDVKRLMNELNFQAIGVKVEAEDTWEIIRSKLPKKLNVPNDLPTWLLALALTSVNEQKDLSTILPEVEVKDAKRETLLKNLQGHIIKPEMTELQNQMQAAKTWNTPKGNSGLQVLLPGFLKQNIERAEKILDWYNSNAHSILPT